MTYRPRIFVHAPSSPDPARAEIKSDILGYLEAAGLALQEFGFSGVPADSSWTFDSSIKLMRLCDGAVILALGRWSDADGRPIPSEFSHFEGALALSRGLPTLIIAERGMKPRGILSLGGRDLVVDFEITDYEAGHADRQLQAAQRVKKWLQQVQSRKDVFFGYSGAASALAKNIKGHLEERALSVVDWPSDFRRGHTILEEVQQAAQDCRCGLFLLTADDRLAWSRIALPRDNVLLETGFFLSTAGRNRTILIKERGAKIPTDLDGIIYEVIESRRRWRPVAERVAKQIWSKLDEGLT